METATIATKTQMIVESIKDFAANKGFTQIAPVVRVNENGYPFLTFIDANNVAENIYFSRKAATSVPAGTPVTKDMLVNYQIGYTKNEQGEDRVKLISNSERVNLSDLF
jgi:hypothetical protein